MTSTTTIERVVRSALDSIGVSKAEMIACHLQLREICLDDYSPENIEEIRKVLQRLLGEKRALALKEFMRKELDRMTNRGYAVPNALQIVGQSSNSPENRDRVRKMLHEQMNANVVSESDFARALESTFDILGKSSKERLLHHLGIAYGIDINRCSDSDLMPKLEEALAEIFGANVASLLIKEINARIETSNK